MSNFLKLIDFQALDLKFVLALKPKVLELEGIFFKQDLQLFPKEDMDHMITAWLYLMKTTGVVTAFGLRNGESYTGILTCGH